MKILFVALVLAGCAANFLPPPLPANHPANPDAPAAPMMALSQTLEPGAFAENPAPKVQPEGEMMDHDSMDHGAADHSSGKQHAPGHGAHHWEAPKEAQARKNPIPASKESIARGRELFQTHCATCHGKDARGDRPTAAPLDPKPVDLKAMAGQHSDGDFAWKIANGRGAMPAWKGVLDEKQIWELVNFIKSLDSSTKKPAGHDHGKHAH
jgi:mono/diheme cytochrome c family protein